MEMINGCTVLPPSESAETVRFSPDTEGAYVVLVGGFPPNDPGPPLHVHPNTDEAFYIADGDATFLLGDREVLVSGGSVVFVPRGRPHTVWNAGDSPVRGIILISPADAEHELVPVNP